MTKQKKPKPNPIEKAIGNRARPSENIPPKLSEIPDEPSPQEMLTLEELNRQTEERLRDEPEIPPRKTIKNVLAETIPTPVSKLDHLPVTKTSSQESQPPQKTKEELPVSLESVMEANRRQNEINEEILSPQKIDMDLDKADKIIREQLPEAINEAIKISAEDKELTALKKYILEDGFVVSGVAMHIVMLCSQPLVTPSTTTWDFVDRAKIPDMVLAILRTPGYLEGIWASLKIVMGTNKGNAAWTAGIATTIAFFDCIRTLPALEELKK